MTSRSSFLPRISFSSSNGNPILPLHAKRRDSNEYDLAELSPRASSPLLSPDRSRNFENQQSLSQTGSGERKRKGKAVAYAENVEEFPPISVVDRMRIHRENHAAWKERERQDKMQSRHLRSPPSWRPPSPSDFRDDEDDEHYSQISYGQASASRGANPRMSFIGLLNPSQSTTAERGFASDVDNTFRTLQRRNLQIQKELQKLLDLQAATLEHGGAGAASSDIASHSGSDTPRRTSRASSSSPYRSRADFRHDNSRLAPVVVPVRQPKPRPLTIRQIRTSIARSMAILADLKEEEDAYIASAISARKTALAKANKLSHQYKAITADLRSLQSDDPLQRELNSLTEEHKKVRSDIEAFELKLKALKNTKRQLEVRMEEVRSERESGLSGYRGALRETERGIGEMMRSPGVKILAPEEMAMLDTDTAGNLSASGSTAKGSDATGLTGREFMSMRPERRTLAMAKEWWESEITLLNQRKSAVDKERSALEEGLDIWKQVTDVIVDYERRLATALDGPSASIYSAAGGSENDKDSIRHAEEAMFQKQYRDLSETIKLLQSQLGEVEAKGWNLLVAAIGAELEGFRMGEEILSRVMKAKGLGFLIEDDEQETEGRLVEDRDIIDEEVRGVDQDDHQLSGSVVRRWAHQDGSPDRSSSPAPNPASPLPHAPSSISNEDFEKHNDPPPDLLISSDNEHGNRDESDNEVPPDLLVHQESEDEHANEVPSEFLSMHDSNTHEPESSKVDVESRADEQAKDEGVD
ncbi:hypothetical protein BX600DRAFT_506278 [Xylariales sp. PMI_506]|nr:hypothetical protein BX600DRAFT_506278 [Xylariales sp. PMI_506]